MPHQDAVLRDPARVRLLRTGNQLGKTTAGVIDLLCTAIGDHPWNRAAELDHADEFWVLCATWAQSINIQRKIWALAPKELLHPKTTFNEIRGFGWMNPVFQIKHRSGEYSTVRIKTTQQGALALAGASIPYAWFDEPPATDRVYAEVSNRVRKYGARGRVLITMTPVNAPIEWIRELVASGAIQEHWYRLEPSLMRPMHRVRDWASGQYEPGGLPLLLEDGSPCDEAWIDKITAQSLPHEVPVVVHGEWESRSMDRYFSCFRNGGPDSHVHTRVPEHDVTLLLGVDHGSAPGKQIVLLIAVWREDGRTRIYVVDEYTDKLGTATPATDAQQTIAMLGRFDLKWGDLSFVGGDRVHMKGTGSQKSNKDLAAQVARLIGVPLDELKPPIRTIKRGEGRGKGSVAVRARWLFHRMLEPGGFGVHPRCERLIDAFEKYDLRDNEYKDPIDALVYGLDQYIFDNYTQTHTTVRFR